MSDPSSQFSLARNLDTSLESRITYFALTDSRSRRIPFGIKRSDRERHTYVIGKTGMGKSTLLENMAIQDIQNGEGLCFIDPHGGTAEKLLEYIPEERVKDVLYFAPFDLEYPISFNVLEKVETDKRHFVVAGLMSTFEKIWVDAWSARMAYILQNTLAGLLEFPGATLLGVNRMYVDKDYRKAVISNITDPAVRSFWVDEYSKYTDRYTQEATPAIQNKIGQFQSNALVRNIIGQPQSAFDLRTLMDERKIFIVNLSKGRIGEGNARLLGSMLITKVYLAAMSRADASASTLRQLPNFFLYVDEFQNFANRSFADILSEARKYKLCLTIAHQYIEQMEEEVRAAVFGNVGTMMTFRVGAFDAEVLEKEFAPVFTADDLVNLGARQIYLKLMIDGVSSQPFSAVTMPPIEEPRISNRDRAIAHSRAQFSRPRSEVEREIDTWMGHSFVDPAEEAKEREKAERRFSQRSTEGQSPRSRTEERERPFERTVPRSTPGSHSGFAPNSPSHSRPRIAQGPPPTDGYRAPRAPLTPPPPVRDSLREAEPTPLPRPLPPRTRPMENRLPSTHHHGALKDILAKVVPHVPVAVQGQPLVHTSRGFSPSEPEVSIAPQVRAVSGQAPREIPRIVPQPPLRSNDDGKGVSPEGRQELRNLLAQVTHKGNTPQVRPSPAVPTQPLSRPNTREVVQVLSQGKEPTPTPMGQETSVTGNQRSEPPVQASTRVVPSTGASHQSPQIRREIPEDTLRKLLDVKRPTQTEQPT